MNRNSSTEEKRGLAGVVENKKTKRLFDKLVERRTEFDKKYLMVKMVKLVRENCKNLADVRKLIECLEVLLKYCENLINPESMRPQKWLTISQHNKTFMDKVQPIKGHKEILGGIGYTEELRGCLIHNKQVNSNFVAQVYLELKAIQLELSLWLEKRHPYPELFYGIIPLPESEPNTEPETKPPPSRREEICGALRLEDISPNATLTQENAKHLLRRHQKSMDEPMEKQNRCCTLFEEDSVTTRAFDRAWSTMEAPTNPKLTPANVVVLRRNSKDKRPDPEPCHYQQDSMVLVPPAPREELAIDPASLRPNMPVLADNEWHCMHCGFNNPHLQESCRGRLLHICEVCFRTTEVLCHTEAWVVIGDRTKSLLPQMSSNEEKGERQREKEEREREKKEAERMMTLTLDKEMGGDFESKMRAMELRMEREIRLLWSGRKLLFIKLLHDRLGQVPEEEIHFLFSRVQSKMTTQCLDFPSASDEVLHEWEATQASLADLLRSNMVYRTEQHGPSCTQMIREMLVQAGGEPRQALDWFLKKWIVQLEALKRECSIPDLSDEDYSSALYHSGGVIENAKARLIKERYINLIIGEDGPNGEVAMDLYRDTRHFDPQVNQKIKDKTILHEKRVRLLMCECDIEDPRLADRLVCFIDSSANVKDLCIVDFLEALEGNDSINKASKQLRRDCPICCESKPIRSFLKMLRCDCMVCNQCVKEHFRVKIMEAGISSLVCPSCQKPKIRDDFSDLKYFPLLTKLLTNILDRNVMDCLGNKLTMWALKNDEVVQCPWDCEEQFTMDDVYFRAVNAVKCPKCMRSLCTKCLGKWEGNWHDCDAGDVCNLERDLITCPKCKQAFYHVKGGCLHMKCTKCSHEFCVECRESYKNNDCGRFPGCSSMGMHCHHPRNCFYFIRDMKVPLLQKLLKKYEVRFSTPVEPSCNQATSLPTMPRSPEELQLVGFTRSVSMCQNRVQRSDHGTEEPCGELIYDAELGLCSTHYIEHLYKIIRDKHLDPVHVMDESQLQALLKSNQVRFLRNFEVPGSYWHYLVKVVKENIPLKKYFRITGCPRSLFEQDSAGSSEFPSSPRVSPREQSPLAAPLNGSLVPRGFDAPEDYILEEEVESSFDKTHDPSMNEDFPPLSRHQTSGPKPGGTQLTRGACA